MNLAYQMLTRTERSFWEVTSAMQNAIRKGDYDVASYGMWELLPQYTPYLRKRLLVISAEDCFGIITKEIAALCKVGDEESLTRALSLLCLAKKNRDADYFVCNLMTLSNPTNLPKERLGQELFSAIRRMNVVKAGELSMELFKSNRKYLWKLLKDMAIMYYPHLFAEIEALCEANETVTKPTEETIFAAKAIVLMWTSKRQIEHILGYDGMDFDELLSPDQIPVPYKLDDCKKIKGLFPEWAYNWHTYYGKYTLRRDAVHAIENDQRLLDPLEENLFDDCSWNRDINACLLKHNPNNYQLPYDDGKRNPGEKYATED